MDRQQAIKMLEELSNVNGVSGFEDDVLTVLRKYGEGLGEFKEDSLRNLYLSRKENKGGRPVVQLDAHSDEVGFMVHAIKPNGMLQFITLGGWVPNTIPAHRVRVRNADGDYITGIVATKPPHFMTEEERKASLTVSDMAIDIGASSREEAMESFKIRVGAPIVPDANFEYNEQRDLLIGKAFDCRMGCGAILKTLNGLKGRELAVDVVAGFSVQEEVGLRGATVTGNVINPSACIVFEGCPADDNFSEPYLIQTGVKRGPMLRHFDARMITNPRFLRYTLDLAAKLGIPVQEAVRTGGATNGGPIHLAHGSVPVIVIGLPVRYIHTHYGIAAYSDFDHAVKLGTELVKTLDPDVISTF